MKITKTKRSIALKISKSVGAWPHDGKWAVQNRDGEILISGGQYVPVRRVGKAEWELEDPISSAGTFDLDDGWFQCILSRGEYFHLYPAPDADGWIEWEGGECPVGADAMVDTKHRCGRTDINRIAAGAWWNHSTKGGDIVFYRLHKTEAEVDAPKPERIVIEPAPTIEQLTADYRAKLAIARKAREEADAANREADAALCKLEHAGEAIGLLIFPIKDDRNLAED